jgi:DNA (cytosine-5)-methyltransferase 1
VNVDSRDKCFPDLKLYEEVIFLENWFKGKYVVENVIPYYEPLIQANKRDRHLYWTNFRLPNNVNARHFDGLCQTKNEVEKLSKFHDYDFKKYKGNQLLNKIARNLVDYEVGRTILETALNIHKSNNTSQLSLI